MRTGKLPLVTSKNSSDKVYDFLLEKIHQRFWPVNSKIMTENELCAELEVSRIAVREAVERLVALGLLIKRQGSGTFVADPRADSCFDFLFPMILLDETNTYHLLEFRGQFDSTNVRLFMKHHTKEDITALERNYQMMLATRHTDVQASARFDYEFHQLIAKGTHNPFIIRISKILTNILQSHQSELYRTADMDQAFIYHRDIIKYIKRGDTRAAVNLMRSHIKVSMKAFRRHHETKRIQRQADDLHITRS